MLQFDTSYITLEPQTIKTNASNWGTIRFWLGFQDKVHDSPPLYIAIMRYSMFNWDWMVYTWAYNEMIISGDVTRMQWRIKKKLGTRWSNSWIYNEPDDMWVSLKIGYTLKYGGFLKFSGTANWMAKMQENPSSKWMMTGGTLWLRKPPYGDQWWPKKYPPLEVNGGCTQPAAHPIHGGISRYGSWRTLCFLLGHSNRF